MAPLPGRGRGGALEQIPARVPTPRGARRLAMDGVGATNVARYERRGVARRPRTQTSALGRPGQAGRQCINRGARRGSGKAAGEGSRRPLSAPVMHKASKDKGIF